MGRVSDMRPPHRRGFDWIGLAGIAWTVFRAVWKWREERAQRDFEELEELAIAQTVQAGYVPPRIDALADEIDRRRRYASAKHALYDNRLKRRRRRAKR